MYDRPNLTELIDAARLHLEQQIIPAVRADPKLYFQTLVAINVLKIAMRELELAPAHAYAEWVGLNTLRGVEITPSADVRQLQSELHSRNHLLCQQIRAGDYDAAEPSAALLQHIKMTTIAQLEAANPKFLQGLAKEDASGAV
ncbi:MAG: hypothetical protein H7Y11_11725 [Armatimonadetes bacterium]|nr:hypothetical protein [Anaerolineae bacterium]